MDKKVDWVKLNKEFRGLWITLDEKETMVVSSAKDAKVAYKKAIDKGFESPILFRVPDEALSYIGVC